MNLMNVTLKDIPGYLHRQLRMRAKNHGRSLNKEVLTILESVVSPVKRSPTELLEQIELRREQMSMCLTEESLDQIISEGRE
jgi:plasmid stability protein